MMAGQGAVTNQVSNSLVKNGRWRIVYKCIPNTSHFGVVPIPTPLGSSAQRYPDIVLIDNETTWLIEVEIRLTFKVFNDIKQRFTEMRSALFDTENWEIWKAQAERVSGLTLPSKFLPKTTLIVCKDNTTASTGLAAKLADHSIETIYWKDLV